MGNPINALILKRFGNDGNLWLIVEHTMSQRFRAFNSNFEGIKRVEVRISMWKIQKKGRPLFATNVLNENPLTVALQFSSHNWTNVSKFTKMSRRTQKCFTGAHYSFGFTNVTDSKRCNSGLVQAWFLWKFFTDFYSWKTYTYLLMDDYIQKYIYTYHCVFTAQPAQIQHPE